MCKEFKGVLPFVTGMISDYDVFRDNHIFFIQMYIDWFDQMRSVQSAGLLYSRGEKRLNYRDSNKLLIGSVLRQSMLDEM